MTDNNHPITPPPELVRHWWYDTHGAFYEFEAVVTQAARWGADEQLEMDATWVALQTSNQMSSKRLIAEMRPKPPSLKEQAPKPPSLKEQALSALYALATGACDTREFHQDLETIKEALDSLPS